MEPEQNKEFLLPYAKAKYPCIWVNTVEPDRFIEAMVQEVKGKWHCFTWDLARGFKQENHDGMPAFGWGTDTEIKSWYKSDALDVIRQAAAGPEKSIWSLQNFHWELGSEEVIQEILNLSPLFKTKAVMLCIVSPSRKIPLELERVFHPLNFVLPTKEELGIVLNRTAQGNKIEVSSDERDAILSAGCGLTWEEFENASYLSIVKKKKLDPKYITRQKAQMIEQAAGLKLANFHQTFEDIEGLDNLKSWLLEIVLHPIPHLPPRGVLLLGVPGTGKSSIAKALANVAGLECVEMNMAGMFGSLVGETEERMQKALDVVDAMGRVIAYIDEIEKGLAGVGSEHEGDSGTTKRAGGIFLKWMQDRTTPAFVIATCNNLASLPAEYTRPGRWDNIFFIDLPSSKEAEAILKLYVKKYLKRDLRPGEKIPSITGFTGSEIEQLVKNAAYAGGDLVAGSRYVIPMIKSRKKYIDKIREDGKMFIPASNIEVVKPLSESLKGVIRIAEF